MIPAIIELNIINTKEPKAKRIKNKYFNLLGFLYVEIIIFLRSSVKYILIIRSEEKNAKFH